MQQLTKAVAVFCTACICAEVVSQLTQRGWPRRCIKAVAGLYILVVFGRVLPQAKTTLRAFSLPQATAASLGTLSEATAAAAQDSLEAALAARCREEVGVEVTVDITLAETNAGWAAADARVTLPPGCPESQRAAVATLLEDALGVAPTVSEADGGQGT